MKNGIKALMTVDYRLWVAILSMMLFPSIYQTIRIFFLGNLPSDWGVNIASQLSWLNLIYEVIQEVLILPLFFLLGKSLSCKSELENKVKTGLISITIIYFIISCLLIIFARKLVLLMAQDVKLINATVIYVRLESVGILFFAISRFIVLVLILLKKEKYLYLTLIVQMVMSVVLDAFLISRLSFSANIGVNGIAIANITVSFLTVILGFFFLQKEKIHLFAKCQLSFAWLKEWFQVGKYSGIESLIRNLVFLTMIIRMTNIIAEQGNYWVANNFIWHWLLLPALALSDLVKKEIGEKENNIRTKTYGYLMFAGILSIVWLLSIPLWKPFLRHVMNVANYESVYYIVLLQTGSYLTFIFNSCVLDSTFYAVGKTNYMLIQSICIDVFYYGIIFILYVRGFFIPSLTGISLMFGIGMFLDLIPTLILYKKLLIKKNMQIDF